MLADKVHKLEAHSDMPQEDYISLEYLYIVAGIIEILHVSPHANTFPAIPLTNDDHHNKPIKIKGSESVCSSRHV